MQTRTMERGVLGFGDPESRGLQFATYPPSGPDLPWLAVVLADGRPVDMFGCSDREAAERLLRELRARRDVWH